MRARALTVLLLVGSSAPASAADPVVVVENGLVTRVQRGENGGRTLHHDCVVRAFDSGELIDGAMTVRLEVPSDLVTSRSRVIALLQDADTLRVLGAATARLR